MIQVELRLAYLLNPAEVRHILPIRQTLWAEYGPVLPESAQLFRIRLGCFEKYSLPDPPGVKPVECEAGHCHSVSKSISFSPIESLPSTLLLDTRARSKNVSMEFCRWLAVFGDGAIDAGIPADV